MQHIYNRVSLVWLPLTSTPFHSLLWKYHIWFMPNFWGMQLGHKTWPGHANMQHWRFSNDWFCMCASWSLSYSTLFISEWLTAPTFRACAPLTHVPCVSECPWEGLGNIRPLYEWGTSSEVGAIICHVECITPSFLIFFQFGENAQWIMDGFALARMCARCADIGHFCTKTPWV